METQAKKQTRTIKIILYIFLFLANTWCAIDSFYEYAGTFKTKTLIKGIIFFVFIFFFAWQAIVEYKLHRAKQKAEEDI